MDEAEIVRRRLASQFLTTAGPASPSDVVRTLGAVQAQDYAGAKWALGQRAPGSTDVRIERELTAGAILRTHVLRPTWHFVAPEDLRWMLALTAPRVKASMASYNRKLGLDARLFRKSHAAIEKALAREKHLTRAELSACLAPLRIGVVTGQRLAHIVMEAELDALICSGPRRGKQSTYALVDERAPATSARDRDDALGELARRYFTTRGPATIHDFSWWSGLSVADSRRAVQIVHSDLLHVSIKGRDAWFVERTLPRTTLGAHLLPNYDEYFIGYKDRSAIGRRTRSAAHVTGGSFLINHVAFIKGDLVGGWKRFDHATGTRVDMQLATRIAASERKAITVATNKLGKFLGTRATLKFI